ncbi:MAG: hypothetical protein J2P24_02370 [Streptosporangiales bacterium]|nr:hypothetical protein [Streptosporangiales bacterium]MBO0889337.1 hypothetical protein [Acidothermales bacterium]
MSVTCPGCGGRLTADQRFCTACGRPVRKAATARPATTAEKPRPTPTASPRDALRSFDLGAIRRGGLPGILRHRVLFAGVGLVVVLVVLLVVGLVVYRATGPSPKDVVSAYFACLGKRDARCALSHLRPQPGTFTWEPPDARLMTDSVLRAKEYRPPSHVRVGEPTGDGDGRSVRVTYDLLGRRESQVLAVSKASDSGLRGHWLIDEWQETGATGLLAIVNPKAPYYLVNGQRLVSSRQPKDSALDQAPAFKYSVFPGRYQLTVPDNPLLATSAKVAALPMSAAEADVRLDLTVKESAKAEIRRQVRAHLEQCVRVDSLNPPNCPFSSLGGAGKNEHDFSWKLTRYPSFDVGISGESGAVEVSTPIGDEGRADLTYAATDFFTGKPVKGTDWSPVAPKGRVVLRDHEVVYQPA